MVGVLFRRRVLRGRARVCLHWNMLMTRLDVRRRVMVGESGLPLLILGVNCLSLAMLWLCSAILVAAGGNQLYLQVAVISVGAQAVWLSQHLWFYYRDHPRVRYESTAPHCVTRTAPRCRRARRNRRAACRPSARTPRG